MKQSVHVWCVMQCSRICCCLFNTRYYALFEQVRKEQNYLLLFKHDAFQNVWPGQCISYLVFFQKMVAYIFFLTRDLQSSNGFKEDSMPEVVKRQHLKIKQNGTNTSFPSRRKSKNSSSQICTWLKVQPFRWCSEVQKEALTGSR